MRTPTSTAWAVRLRVGWAAYYFGWSPQHPRGYAAPLNAKRAPCLRFATETEAEIACEAYLGMSPDPYPADVVRVKASPTHRLTNAGFAPVPLAEAFALFATPAQPAAMVPGPVDNSRQVSALSGPAQLTSAPAKTCQNLPSKLDKT